MDNIRRNLCELLRLSGMTSKELADKLSYSLEDMDRVLFGELMLRPAELEMIAEYFRVSKKELINGTITANKTVTTEDLLDKAYEQGYLSGFDSSLLIQKLLVSEGGWVLDTGNYENVNAEVALRLAEKIKRHPRLWKLFFMVA